MVAATNEAPQVQCKTRSLTVWPNKCGCPNCHPVAVRMMKAKRTGVYRRIEPAEAYKVLDRMVALGYDGRAAWSAINYPALSVDTVREWLKARREGRDVQIGPGGCQLIVNASKPTTGRMHLTVAQRKLRALGRMGYTIVEIARLVDAAGLGPSKRTLQAVRAGSTSSITAEMNTAVDQVYRRLVKIPAPEDAVHNLMRQRARRARWVSPMDWANIDHPACEPDRSDLRMDGIDVSRHFDSVDPAVVDALVAGRNKGVRPTKAERVEVVKVLRGRGMTHGEITRLTGIGHPERYYQRASDG